MYEQELKNYRMLNELAEPDGIVIFGGNADRELPLCELKQAFSIEQGLYNRSLPELSVRDAAEWYAACTAPLHPETVLLHIGEADRGWFAENSDEFDHLYRNLIAQIRKLNKKCRIAVLSLQSPADDPVICEMNRHLRYIAESEHCEYGDLAEKRVWNPKETKEVASFVQAMGLVRSRRTMYDLVKILFGCTTVQET